MAKEFNVLYLLYVIFCSFETRVFSGKSVISETRENGFWIGSQEVGTSCWSRSKVQWENRLEKRRIQNDRWIIETKDESYHFFPFLYNFTTIYFSRIRMYFSLFFLITNRRSSNVRRARKQAEMNNFPFRYIFYRCLRISLTLEHF